MKRLLAIAQTALLIARLTAYVVMCGELIVWCMISYRDWLWWRK